ncbi:MAG: DNA methylase, partial [Nanoarchaeota archaeon]|nr:DNA methylase [Nanoarchaeota archaeon]
EMYRVLKPNGVSVIVYAHKSVAGWETLVNSLLDSGLVVSGAWPIHTEMKTRLRASESAALASSIYMIARKTQKTPIGFYNEVKQELRKHLDNKLDQIWNEGISGADFFISAIGSAIEVFSKYGKVIDDEGTVVRADRFLEDIRKIVTDYAVRQVLHNGFAGEIKPLTRFYVLWRWAYGDRMVEFDEARKLGQSVGVDVSQEWNRGFILKKKEFIQVLGPEDRKMEQLDNPTELIDVLHKVLLLWKNGRSEDIANILRETGFGKSDVFYRVAQAISESLPNDSGEKKLLEGFLAGKERFVKESMQEAGQRRLFE